MFGPVLFKVPGAKLLSNSHFRYVGDGQYRVQHKGTNKKSSYYDIQPKNANIIAQAFIENNAKKVFCIICHVIAMPVCG